MIDIEDVRVIGDEVWANGYRVARLTNEAPPSVAGAFRDALPEIGEERGACILPECPRAA